MFRAFSSKIIAKLKKMAGVTKNYWTLLKYPKYYFILAPKDVLQMSTSTFKSLFEFLIQFAMPDYTLKIDSNNPLQTVLFELLRKMNYPGPLNKSHFQTIGGFNLSHNLGVLHFLWTLAKLANGIFDDFSKSMNWLYFKTKITHRKISWNLTFSWHLK